MVEADQLRHGRVGHHPSLTPHSAGGLAYPRVSILHLTNSNLVPRHKCHVSRGETALVGQLVCWHYAGVSADVRVVLRLERIATQEGKAFWSSDSRYGDVGATVVAGRGREDAWGLHVLPRSVGHAAKLRGLPHGAIRLPELGTVVPVCYPSVKGI